MKEYQKQFIEYAIKLGVLKFGDFTLKSGRKSPYFFNFGLFNSGAALNKIGHYYAQTILDSQIPFDVLFGPAYKGIPLVSATALCLSLLLDSSNTIAGVTSDVPYAFNRKEKKDHGEGGEVVGTPLKPGTRVIIVDDVITAGTAIRESLTMLKKFGAQAVAVITALDREEIAQEESRRSAIQQVQEDMGLPVLSIIRLKDIINYLEQTESYPNELRQIKEYREKYGI